MRIRLDDPWQFHLGDIPGTLSGNPIEVKAGFARGAASPDFDDTGWRTVRLPHDWGIESAPSPEAISSQGYYPRGVGWYRKALTLPPGCEDRRLVLEFEGMARNATVWVNGSSWGAMPRAIRPSCATSPTPCRAGLTRKPTRRRPMIVRR